jgi:GT2 family glycosyltransferase
LKMTLPKVSILISVFEQLAYTKRCLRALEDTLPENLEYEVLIVDDCSKDGTVEFLKGLEEPCLCFFNTEKKGFAKNNNFAASKAKGEFLCFLNNDVFVDGDWLLPMIEVFREKPDAGVVGNVQKLASSKKFDHMGVVFGPQGNPRHFGQWFKNSRFQGEVRKWSAVTAACCLVKKEKFLELNGFDESYLNGCEDVDLCLRFNRHGTSNYVVHDSIVIHVKGATEGRKRFNLRNSQILMERWGEQIKSNESVTDQRLHAVNYIYRGMIRPFSVNLWKWLEAVAIYLKIKKLF